MQQRETPHNTRSLHARAPLPARSGREAPLALARARARSLAGAGGREGMSLQGGDWAAGNGGVPAAGYAGGVPVAQAVPVQPGQRVYYVT